jgi:predicted CXXCH cytochrome family protein
MIIQADSRCASSARQTITRTLMLVTGLGSLAVAANWPQENELSRALRGGPGVVNHPIGVRPSERIRVPEGWPLDAGGRLTCTTCHESLPALSGRGGAKLRGAAGSSADPGQFCARCHAGPLASGASGMHWMAMSRAHVSASHSDRVGGYGDLDADSRRCLSCHDGVTARETTYQTGTGHVAMSLGSRARNHPVGIPYRAMGRERGEKLRVAQALPKAVRLPEGRVSCVSCHNLYSPEPNRLSVPIDGSALCLSCHEMD